MKEKIEPCPICGDDDIMDVTKPGENKVGQCNSRGMILRAMFWNDRWAGGEREHSMIGPRPKPSQKMAEWPPWGVGE